MSLRYISRMNRGMHRTWLPLIAWLWLAISLSLPSSGAAQAPMRVRCDSEGGRWKHCALPFQGEVTVLRQISREPCIRNHSWGRDQAGLWVARGCRAEFGPVSRQESEAATTGGAKKYTLRCESRISYRHCPADISGTVRLVRQLSRMECERDKSWGYDEDGIWVSKGCRAEFEVTSTAKPRGLRFFRWLFGGERQTASDAKVEAGRPLRCESVGGQRRECRVQSATRVELEQQRSNAACVFGQSWGWSGDHVWVSNGCRGEFRVW